MAEYVSTLKASVDFSNKRDGELQEVFDAIPYLKINPFYFADTFDKSTIKDFDSYPTYSKRRIYADRATNPRLYLGAGVLEKPVAVWRDFREGDEDRKGTVAEFFFGIVGVRRAPEDKRKALFVLVLVQRNVVAKIITSENELDLFDLISGLQIHKRF